MSLYKHGYDSLRQDPTEFRLVTIHRGVSPNPISVTLATHRLDNHPPYEALSYVWGPFDEASPDLIQLNGSWITTTINLSQALYALRKKENERTMWIDAICINQDDLDERSSQVRLMRNIYRSSSTTVVWLGTDTFLSTPTFAFLKGIGVQLTPANLSTSVYFIQQKEPEDKVLQQLVTDEKARRLVQRGFYGDIGKRDFWTRIWVVQEVALSSRVSIVCGDNEMDWEDFHQVVWVVDQASNKATVTPTDEGNIGGLSNIETFAVLQKLVTRGFKIKLSDALALLRRSRSTDPRDMVYGLLGLISQTSIQPDYSNANMQDVYLGLVHHCITEENSLDIITLCWKTGRNPSLPSWVPDWSESWIAEYEDEMEGPAIPLILKYGSGSLYHLIEATDDSVLFTKWFANGSIAPKASIDKSLLTITAQGISIDRICSVGDYTSRTEDDGEIFFFELFRNWEDILLQRFGVCNDTRSGRSILDVFDRCLNIMIGYLSNSNADFAGEAREKLQQRLLEREEHEVTYRKSNTIYKGGCSIVEAFVRTIVTDTDASFGPISTAKYDAFWDIDVTETLAWGLEIYALAMATNRRLIISDTGYMGLAPIQTQSGDQICVLYGCSVPVVLREEHEGFNLIGECYVHGLMRGEAIDLARDGVLNQVEWVIR
ncbi:hypothetical protein VTL71DRAFT_4349 [Oculimacula yallundae]|uniref:Heterokaryon incompatibility domain-containing protein n=1 Tax=Oculimacula yallundae TaxID=86028 RepID=A0ABR4C1R5_9HELO